MDRSWRLSWALSIVLVVGCSTLFLRLVGDDGNPAVPRDPMTGHGEDDYQLAAQAWMRNEPPYVAPELQAAAPTLAIAEPQVGAAAWQWVEAAVFALCKAVECVVLAAAK